MTEIQTTCQQGFYFPFIHIYACLSKQGCDADISYLQCLMDERWSIFRQSLQSVKGQGKVTGMSYDRGGGGGGVKYPEGTDTCTERTCKIHPEIINVTF